MGWLVTVVTLQSKIVIGPGEGYTSLVDFLSFQKKTVLFPVKSPFSTVVTSFSKKSDG